MIHLIILSNQLSKSQVEYDVPAVDCSRPAARRTDPGGSSSFDANGSVGASDLLTLLANWGPCP